MNDDKENKMDGRSVGDGQSPSRRRSDASSFSFRNIPPNTPLRNTPLKDVLASARKKSHPTPSIDFHNNNISQHQQTNTNDLSTSTTDSSYDGCLKDLMVGLDTSSANDTSHSSSSVSSGLMNRTVLSDTTEVTASIFVRAASSKQCLLDVTRSEKKRKRKEEAKEKQHRAPLEEIHLNLSGETSHSNVANKTTANDDDAMETDHQSQQQQSSFLEQLKHKETSSDDNAREEDKEIQTNGLRAPSGLATTTQPKNKENNPVNNPPRSRRSSLLTGSSPLAAVNPRIQASPNSIRKMTASLKRNRLQRRLERDRNIRKRLSTGVANKKPVVPAGRTPGGSRFSIGSAFAKAGRGSIGSRRSSSGGESAGEHTGELSWNLSSKLAQSPLESADEKEGPDNGSEKPFTSPEFLVGGAAKPAVGGQNGYEDTTEINFDFDKWIRDPIEKPAECDVEASVRNGTSAVALRRLSKTDNKDRKDGDASISQQYSETQSVDSSTRKPFTLVDSMSKSLGSSAAGCAASIRDPFSNQMDDKSGRSSNKNGSEVSSKRRSTSSTSTGSIGQKDLALDNTTKGSADFSSIKSVVGSNNKDDWEHSQEESKRSSPPREISVAMGSQETTPRELNGMQSPTSTTEAAAHRAPGSSSKITPTRLKKRPRRIANPDAITSPAHNTRGAVKKRALVEGDQTNVPDASPATGNNQTQLVFDQNVDSSATKEQRNGRESLAPSVTTRASRRSSATSDYPNINDILGSTFGDTDDDDDGMTVDFSIGDLLGRGDEGSRRSSIGVTNRRSSTFRASLSSLPENGPGLDVASIGGKSGLEEAGILAKQKHRRSNRRKSSAFLLPSMVVEENDTPKDTALLNEHEAPDKPQEKRPDAAKPVNSRSPGQNRTRRHLGTASIDSPARHTRSAGRSLVEGLAMSPASKRGSEPRTQGPSGSSKEKVVLSPPKIYFEMNEDTVSTAALLAQANPNFKPRTSSIATAALLAQANPNFKPRTSSIATAEILGLPIGRNNAGNRDSLSTSDDILESEKSRDGSETTEKSIANSIKSGSSGSSSDTTSTVPDINALLGSPSSESKGGEHTEHSNKSGSSGSSSDTTSTIPDINAILASKRKVGARDSISAAGSGADQEHTHDSNKSGSSGSTTSTIPDIDAILGLPSGTSQDRQRDSISTDSSGADQEHTEHSNKSGSSGSSSDATATAPDIKELLASFSSEGDQERMNESDSTIDPSRQDSEDHQSETSFTSSKSSTSVVSTSSRDTKRQRMACSHQARSDAKRQRLTNGVVEGLETPSKSDTLPQDGNAASLAAVEASAKERTAATSGATTHDASPGSDSNELETSFDWDGGKHKSKSTANVGRRSSILASALKRSRSPGIRRDSQEHSVRKSVGFKSPSAAEYDVGSMSRSLTPMPKSQVKALFQIPGSDAATNDTSGSDMSLSSSSSDPDPASPRDINPAIGGNSETSLSSTSSSEPSHENYDEETVTLEMNLDELMNKVETEISTGHGQQQELEVDSSQDSLSFNNEGNGGGNQEEATIELETSLRDMFANTANDIDSGGSDSMSLEATNKEETELQDDSSPNLIARRGNDEETTIELESDVDELWNANAEAMPFGDVSAIPLSSPGDESGSPQSQSRSQSSLSFSKEELGDTSSSTAGRSEDEGTVPLENNVSELFAKAMMQESADESRSVDMDRRQSFTAKLEDNLDMVLDPIPAVGADNTSTNHNLSSSLASDDEQTESECDQVSISQLSAAASSRSEESREFSNDSGASKDAFDMDCKELFDLGFPRGIETTSQFPDIVAGLTASSSSALRTNEFSAVLDSICGELEGNIENLEDTNTAFKRIVDSKRDVFFALQERLRQNDDDCRHTIERLGAAVRANCTMEWNNWLAVVLGSLNDPFEEVLESLGYSTSQTTKHLHLAQEGKGEMIAIADSMARRARRKSTGRRKKQSRDVEDEIRQLEQQIAGIQTGKETAKVRNEKASALHVALTKKANQKDPKSMRDQSARSQILYTTIRNIHRVELTGRQTTTRQMYKIAGVYPESSASLTFHVKEDRSKVVCHAKLDSTAFRQRAGVKGVLSRSAKCYLKKSIGDLLKRLTTGTGSNQLNSPGEIGPFLMDLDCRVGRHESTAREISALENRQEMKWLFTNGKTTLEMVVCGYHAMFEFNHLYPFKKMACRFDVLGKGEQAQAKALQRHWDKHVEPGPQYLTRLYDCMIAYLQPPKQF
ncbi:expressed unknown protein [Seminavis robusta]|uniref:Uncharacterized protein n=1 Tax=Seminavis robusta TaxID=568900 RepID=A0A9N8H6C7_9STRA|nr:expressed unknown protein [Seminavis robusta]|eukprot:Sro41_g025120.1 n/a (2224) ;mRNA; f:53774-60527